MVCAVAAHLGIPLEVQLVDLTKGQQHTHEYLAINPTGRTPALADGEFKLWEANAILQYLASQKPNSLWPDNAHARADIMRWQSWCLAHWGKESCEPLTFERLVKQILNAGPPDEAIVTRALGCFNREAKVLEVHLAKHPYLVGSSITLADYSVAAPLFYAERVGFPLVDYPKVREWFGRVSTLPSWNETAPQFAQAA